MKVDMYEILKCVSRHLSNYPGEYEVHIKENSMYMTPQIQVFPNIHNKRNSDKEDLLYHVLFHHFPECLSDSDLKNEIGYQNIKNVENGDVITYKYSYSVKKKYRKWIRTI